MSRLSGQAVGLDQMERGGAPLPLVSSRCEFKPPVAQGCGALCGLMNLSMHSLHNQSWPLV